MAEWLMAPVLKTERRSCQGCMSFFNLLKSKPLGPLKGSNQGARRSQKRIVSPPKITSPVGERIKYLPKPVEIHALLTTITLNTDEDRYEWCPNGSATPVFSTGAIYRLIKQHQPLVPWNKVVWNPRGIRAQLKIESYLGASRLHLHASFATLVDETRDHLFFDYDFSSVIWETLARKARCRPISTWPQLLQYMQQRSCPKPDRILGLLAWQVAIYYTWTERNNRLHRQSYSSSKSIIISATTLIKNKISSFRVSNPRLASAIFQLWVST
uniref:Reverse transcriptase zinc-binding domain-containing protein n=1 Tax=Brassica oleracea var. oleracea TaxID=109376 RepID=A0A0D3EEW0_BRAOL